MLDFYKKKWFFFVAQISVKKKRFLFIAQVYV